MKIRSVILLVHQASAHEAIGAVSEVGDMMGWLNHDAASQWLFGMSNSHGD